MTTWNEYSKFSDLLGGVWILTTIGLNDKLKWSLLPAVGAYKYFGNKELDERVAASAQELVRRYNANPQGDKFPEAWRDEITRTSFKRYGRPETTKFELLVTSYHFWDMHKDSPDHPNISVSDLRVSGDHDSSLF